jgi:hypothetical protein
MGEHGRTFRDKSADCAIGWRTANGVQLVAELGQDKQLLAFAGSIASISPPRPLRELQGFE